MPDMTEQQQAVLDLAIANFEAKQNDNKGTLRKLWGTVGKVTDVVDSGLNVARTMAQGESALQELDYQIQYRQKAKALAMMS